eukprot:gene9712-biopygen6905
MDINGLRKKWKEVGDAIAQVAPVEDRFTLSVVIDSQTRSLKSELFVPGILGIYNPGPQKWDEYFSTSITSVRMEDSSLHEKVLQALSTPVRDPLRDDSADTSEAAQQLLHFETSQGLTEASLAAVEARLTTKIEIQMEQLMKTMIARLSPATAPPSATSVEPVLSAIAAKKVEKEADLFPGSPVVDIAAWKGLLEPASARGRRAIVRDGLMEDAVDATDGPLLNDLFVDLLGFVEGAARSNWVVLECHLFECCSVSLQKYFSCRAEPFGILRARCSTTLATFEMRTFLRPLRRFGTKRMILSKITRNRKVVEADVTAAGSQGTSCGFAREKSMAASKKGKEKRQPTTSP